MTNNDTDIKSLARDLASARNYLFEATMNDYSIESINRGEEKLNQVINQITAAGLDHDAMARYDETKGRWVAVAS